MKKPANIDAYILSWPIEVQQLLEQIRQTIQQAAPHATEAIKYGMPTFVLNGNLIHFAAYQHHIGLYPAPLAIEVFKKELEPYKTSKGAIQFPINQTMPLDLIARITEFRLAKNLEKNKKVKLMLYRFF